MPDATSQDAVVQTAMKQTLGAYSTFPNTQKTESKNAMLARASSIDSEQKNLQTNSSISLITEENISEPSSVKPSRSAVTGVTPPEEVVFRLKSQALEKQVADLTSQVQDLINKIKEEQEKGKKAVLKATIESEGNAEKLQSLVQMQREELLNLKNSLSLETKNSQGKDARIKELETALAENDSLLSTLGGNTYFGQGNEGGIEQVAVNTAIESVKSEASQVLENRREKEENMENLLQELLVELEEVSDCDDIKKEIDDLASSVSPQTGENIVPGSVVSNSQEDTHTGNTEQPEAQTAEDLTSPQTNTHAPIAGTPVTEETFGNSAGGKAKEEEAIVEVPTMKTIELEATATTIPTQETSSTEPNTSESIAITEPVIETPLEISSQEPSLTTSKEEKNLTVTTSETTISSEALNAINTSPQEVVEPSQQTPETVENTPQEAGAPENKEPTSSLLSKETISALFAAAPIATPESYLVSPFGFLSKETAARDLSSFPENLISALASKNPGMLVDATLYNTYKDTKASDIYLSSGSFGGSVEERVKLSAFIRSLLGFFLPNHIAMLPENEVKDILSTATVSALWTTTCQLYEEEKAVSSSSLSSLIMESLGLTAAAIEEKQATLREIVDAVYAKFLNPLLGKKAVQTSDDNEEVSPIIEALRKAFEMDEKELTLNKNHNYQFFMIALKNFLLRENERREIIKLFEEAREETLSALTESDAQKAEILRLFERAKEEAKA